MHPRVSVAHREEDSTSQDTVTTKAGLYSVNTQNSGRVTYTVAM